MNLETLKRIQFVFKLYSDHSCNTNGYNYICNQIKLLEEGSNKDELCFSEEDMLDFSIDQQNRNLEPTKETLDNWIKYR